MHQPLANRPSPALIVALTALVVALAGTATALPGKGTVDKNDIKKNAVKAKQVVNESLTGGDVKNESLTGGDVKNESLTGDDVLNESLGSGEVTNDSLTSDDVKNQSVTGADIDESTLGPVPSVEGVIPVARRLAFGDDVELVANGPISVRAHCIAGDGVGGSGPDPTIRLYVKTTDSATMLSGLNDFDGFDVDGVAPFDDFVTPATLEAEAILMQQINGNASEASTDVDGVIDVGWVVGGDGSYIAAFAEQAVLGINALGANCLVITDFFLRKA